MKWSLKYNNIDLSTYGLYIAMSEASLATLLSSDIMQLQDGAYAPASRAPAKPLTFEIVVTATTSALLFSYLGDIKRICAQKTAGQLILGIQTDRYYTARFESLTGRRVSPLVFEGELRFVADDPLAYDINETTSGPHAITGGDVTFDIPVLGTAYVKPVYTLTSGDALTGITLLVENTDTGEEFSWGPGNVEDGHDFVINVGTMHVTNNAISAMSLVTGQFPRLIPGITNHIKVSDFFDTLDGELNIVYRVAYL